MEQGGFHSDLIGMTVQVVCCNGQGWISLGFGPHDCTGSLVQLTRGMTVQVVWCNGQGWISLGFGWHDCTGTLVQWTRVDFIRVWLA